MFPYLFPLGSHVKHPLDLEVGLLAFPCFLCLLTFLWVSWVRFPKVSLLPQENGDWARTGVLPKSRGGRINFLQMACLWGHLTDFHKSPSFHPFGGRQEFPSIFSPSAPDPAHKHLRRNTWAGVLRVIKKASVQGDQLAALWPPRGVG